MSRFEYADDDRESISYGLWTEMVSRALAGKRGQAALARLEQALVELPEKKLVFEHLASDGSVCAVGAYVAAERAERCKTDVRTEVERLNQNATCGCSHTKADHPDGKACAAKRKDFRTQETYDCTCKEFDQEYEGIYETAQVGQASGLKWTVAWHLAYLNDEQWETCTPEERYEKMLAWTRRALGREEVAA